MAPFQVANRNVLHHSNASGPFFARKGRRSVATGEATACKARGRVTRGKGTHAFFALKGRWYSSAPSGRTFTGRSLPRVAHRLWRCSTRGYIPSPLRGSSRQSSQSLWQARVGICVEQQDKWFVQVNAKAWIPACAGMTTGGCRVILVAARPRWGETAFPAFVCLERLVVGVFATDRPKGSDPDSH